MAFHLCISGKLKVTVRHISCTTVSLGYEPYDNDGNSYKLQKYIDDSTANRPIHSLLVNGIYRVSFYRILNTLFLHGSNERMNYTPLHKRLIIAISNVPCIFFRNVHNPLIFRTQGTIRSLGEYVLVSASLTSFLFKPLGITIRAIIFLLEFACYLSFATNRATISLLRADLSDFHAAIFNCRFKRSH